MLKLNFCMGAIALLWIAPVFATQIGVSSYTINTTPEASYTDGGNDLTDGVLGTTDIIGNPGPWVGWINTNAMQMTFQFASSQEIDSVQIGFLNATSGFFTFLPDSVNINGQIFTVGSNAIPDPSRNFITFNLSPINTSTVNIELDRAGTGFHVLIDEVQFFGSAQTGVPEPAAYLLTAVGLAVCGLVRHLRPRLAR